MYVPGHYKVRTRAQTPDMKALLLVCRLASGGHLFCGFSITKDLKYFFRNIF